jgi:hypothetical protein
MPSGLGTAVIDFGATPSTEASVAVTGQSDITSALKGDGSGGFGAATLNDVGTATASYSLGGQVITNLGNPTSAQDAATRSYVNSSTGYRPSCRVATTGLESFTVSSGSVTQIAGTTVDGVSLSVGDRVLIKDGPASTGSGSPSSLQPTNGIYTVTGNTTNLTLSRAGDMSSSSAVSTPAGSAVFVTAGSVNGQSSWKVTSPTSSAAFTYGSTNLSWGPDVVAGTGLVRSGNTIAIENGGVLTVARGGTGVGTLTGLVKASGTSAFTAAVAGTDYVSPSSTESLTNKTLVNPTITNYTESVVAIGTVTTSSTISLTNGTVQTATLTASTNCTFAMPTAVAGKSFTLFLKQDATTGNGTAVFTGVKWTGGGAPNITAAAGKMDILSFLSDGTNWYGSYSQGYTP